MRESGGRAGPASGPRRPHRNAIRDRRRQREQEADSCGNANTTRAVCAAGGERGSNSTPALTPVQQLATSAPTSGPRAGSTAAQSVATTADTASAASSQNGATNSPGERIRFNGVPSRIPNSVRVFDPSNRRHPGRTADTAQRSGRRSKSQGSGSASRIAGIKSHEQPWPATPRRRGRCQCERTAGEFLRAPALVVARRPPFADTDASQCAEAAYALIHKRLAAGFSGAYRPKAGGLDAV